MQITPGGQFFTIYINKRLKLEQKRIENENQLKIQKEALELKQEVTNEIAKEDISV